MQFVRGLQPDTLLIHMPNNVSKNLCDKLNSDDKWVGLIERMNPSFNRPLNVADYRRNENPTQKLLFDLGNRKFTVEVLAFLLSDLELLEALSTLLKEEAVKIIKEPGGLLDAIEVNLGECFEICCTATGNPLPIIEWQMENTALTQGSQDLEITTTKGTCKLESRLKIFKMSPEKQGKYWCIASSEIPNSPKEVSRDFDVKIKSCKPWITKQPNNICTTETLSFSLICEAMGYPDVEYQWYINDQKIFNQQKSILSIQASSVAQSGKYKCVVSNSAGSSESNEVSVTISERNLLRIEPSRRLQCLEKLALLVANEGDNLVKPVNDIILLAEKLKSVGFKVIALINLGFDEMKNAIETFSNLLKDDVYGVFYYAGHGCRSYNDALIPFYEQSGELQCCSQPVVRPECISASFIKNELLRNNPKIRVIIFDMCLKEYECALSPIIPESDSMRPDINFIVAYATSNNLSSYERKSQPNSTYMTELSKYIDPSVTYSITSIIREVNLVICSREDGSVRSEKEKQIPKHETNMQDNFTFLDDVIGDRFIANYFAIISTPPEDQFVRFKNDDGFELKARISFSPYKKHILNSLWMVIDGVDFNTWKLRIDAEKEIIGMGNVIKITDRPDRFEIHGLEKLRSGINLSIFLQDLKGNIIATTEIVINGALIGKN